MSTLAEAIISAFDSSPEITWTTDGVDRALACFEVTGTLVETAFTATGKQEWRVSFEVSANTSVPESIRILSGVFQAVHEFLAVRQPERLVFAAKAESMGQIYETYLARRDSDFRDLGYRTAPPTKSSPVVEFVVEKSSPSAWRN
jgi:hypothetical protein